MLYAQWASGALEPCLPGLYFSENGWIGAIRQNIDQEVEAEGSIPLQVDLEF